MPKTSKKVNVLTDVPFEGGFIVNTQAAEKGKVHLYRCNYVQTSSNWDPVQVNWMRYRSRKCSACVELEQELQGQAN